MILCRNYFFVIAWVSWAVTYLTSDDMISCLPVYKYIVFLSCFFLSFSVSFFSKILEKIYNIQNHRLFFRDMKNLSLRLGWIRINNSSLRTRCLCVFSQAFVTDFSYHGNTMYYSLYNKQRCRVQTAGLLTQTSVSLCRSYLVVRIFFRDMYAYWPNNFTCKATDLFIFLVHRLIKSLKRVVSL